MSKGDDNRKRIMDRAECICDICQQMKWRKCESGREDYHCDQLISKFADHDHSYMWKSEAAENGERFHYIKIAGVKTPFETLDKYSSKVIEKLKTLKWVHSRYIIEEMNTGRLKNERKELCSMVLQSVGLKNKDPAAKMYVRALEKFVEFRARGWLKWDTDMEIGIWEHVIDRHGIDSIRNDKFTACPPELIKRWEKEHAKV
jgi:hypothetical protein